MILCGLRGGVWYCVRMWVHTVGICGYMWVSVGSMYMCGDSWCFEWLNV